MASYDGLMSGSHRAHAVRTVIRMRWIATLLAALQIGSVFGDSSSAAAIVAYAVVATSFLGNLVLWLRARTSVEEAAHLALPSLVLDLVTILGWVASLTYTGAFVFSSIYVLPLEAALFYQRRGAVTMMGFVAVAYSLHEILAASTYGHPLQPEAIAFRIAVGFVIALVVGTSASRLLAERRRLATSERRLDALLRSSRDVIVVIDTLGSITYASEAVEALTGYRADDLHGRSVLDLVHPSDVPRAVEALARVARGPGATVVETVQIVRSDEEVRWIEAKAYNGFDDDAIRGIVANVHDVTDIKRTEAQLATTNERLATVLANLPGMVYRCRFQVDWIPLFISDGALGLTGHTAQEFLEGTVSYPELVHPHDRDRVWAEVQRAVAEDRPYKIEYRIHDKAGRERWVLEQGRAVDDEHIEGLAIDATERKELESSLARAEKLDAVGRLAGGIAHDFNNILAVVMSYADLIAAEVELDDGVAEDLNEIKSAGQRGANLVRQLLGFSRNEISTPEVLRLSDSVYEVSKMLHRTLGEDIEMEVRANSSGSVYVDRNQLEQVLMNLAVNARDAMQSGGRLSFETNDVHVLEQGPASGPPPGRYVLLRVTDTGEGIPADVLPHMFEPFYTTKGPGRGTGLGLATVYGIVKQAGGHIDVRSKVGEGTTFSVYWPLSYQSPVEDLPPAEVLTARPDLAVRILVVEDEEPVRRVIERILEERGHEVVSVSSAQEALELLQGNGFDLLLTDVVMPGMSGRTLVETARSRERCPEVIFMSGYDVDSLTERGANAGDDPLIQKPFTPDSLLTLVDDVLAESRAAS